MRSVDVGIMLAGEVDFSLSDVFVCNGRECNGRQKISFSDGSLLWNGEKYDRLQFTPLRSAARFTLYDVTIGVDFHWQRNEEQVFTGEIIFFVQDSGVRVVNRVPVEDYLVSVISSEMRATSSLQFLMAHTIISRSWLYAQLLRKENVTCGALGYENEDEVIRWYAREDHVGFDLCADDHCQRYQGLTRVVNENVKRAVEATSGMVLAYGDEVCDARFSKCCGGATERFSACWEQEEKPYLLSFADNRDKTALPDLTNEDEARRWIESAPDAFCNTDDSAVLSQILNGYDREINDFYRWRVQYTQSELSQLVAVRSGIDFGTIQALEPVERSTSGRLVRLRIVGSKRTMVVGKELEIRRWLSTSHLYSSAFVADVDCSGSEPLFVLKGAGWGHGVGLCQIGAALMGEKGCSYSEILSHYYPGSELKNIENILNKR